MKKWWKKLSKWKKTFIVTIMGLIVAFIGNIILPVLNLRITTHLDKKSSGETSISGSFNDYSNNKKIINIAVTNNNPVTSFTEDTYKTYISDLKEYQDIFEITPSVNTKERTLITEKIKKKKQDIKKFEESVHNLDEEIKKNKLDDENNNQAKKLFDEGNYAEARKKIGWGPDRPTFTIDKPADYITFNSITDNPVQGDERNFVQVRSEKASNETYSENISLIPGNEYVVYAYYNNDSSDNLKTTSQDIAENTYIRAVLPAVVSNGSFGVAAYVAIGASNATPKEVWDGISFNNTTGGDIVLRYVPDSLTIHNFGSINGQTIQGDFFGSGAPLGLNNFDGNLSGGNKYAGYITFKFIADQPDFTIEKEVRLKGMDTWKKSIFAEPNDIIEYRIQYVNQGTTTQNDVIIRETISEHMSYISDSTYVKNANNPNGKLVSNNIFSPSGINISNYDKGSNAYIIYQTKIGSLDTFPCGTTSLKSDAFAQTNNGTKKDSVEVKVIHDCE